MTSFKKGPAPFSSSIYVFRISLLNLNRKKGSSNSESWLGNEFEQLQSWLGNAFEQFQSCTLQKLTQHRSNSMCLPLTQIDNPPGRSGTSLGSQEGLGSRKGSAFRAYQPKPGDQKVRKLATKRSKERSWDREPP